MFSSPFWEWKEISIEFCSLCQSGIVLGKKMVKKYFNFFFSGKFGERKENIAGKDIVSDLLSKK